MRINHKSDFDFRLDLYAADPYGTAVAAGFPDCDFTGKLFIGPSARSRQCFIFSKSGSKLVNCFDSDGHIHVIVSGHNLTAGPLFCELTLKVDDSRYPGGFRSVVHTFPLNIYLTETDAEQISPTVSVTLPIMQKVMEKPPTLEDPTEDETPLNRADSRFAEPWLSPRVCGGTIRTGSYVGNIYHNRGRINISGEIIESPKESNFAHVLRTKISSILSLGINGLNEHNLLDAIHFFDHEYENHKWIDGEYLYIANSESALPLGAYISLNDFYSSRDTDYITIDKSGKIRFLNVSPIPEYRIAPPTQREIESISKYIINKRNYLSLKNAHENLVLQVYRRNNRDRTGLAKPRFKAASIRYKTWHTIKEFKFRKDIPYKFRIARKIHNRMSEWIYFCVNKYGAIITIKEHNI